MGSIAPCDAHGTSHSFAPTRTPRAAAEADAMGNAHRSATNAIGSTLPATTVAHETDGSCVVGALLVTMLGLATPPVASKLATSSADHGCARLVAPSARPETKNERGCGRERSVALDAVMSVTNLRAPTSTASERRRPDVPVGVMLAVTVAVGETDAVALAVGDNEVDMLGDGVAGAVLLDDTVGVPLGVTSEERLIELLLLLVVVIESLLVGEGEDVGVADSVVDGVGVPEGVEGELTVLVKLTGGVDEGVMDGLAPVERLAVGLEDKLDDDDGVRE